MLIRVAASIESLWGLSNVFGFCLVFIVFEYSFVPVLNMLQLSFAECVGALSSIHSLPSSQCIPTQSIPPLSAPFSLPSAPPPFPRPLPTPLPPPLPPLPSSGNLATSVSSLFFLLFLLLLLAFLFPLALFLLTLRAHPLRTLRRVTRGGIGSSYISHLPNSKRVQGNISYVLGWHFDMQWCPQATLTAEQTCRRFLLKEDRCIFC